MVKRIEKDHARMKKGVVVKKAQEKVTFKPVKESFERISVAPTICHGKACIKGTRIPVHIILDFLAEGESIKKILEEYPTLDKEDILEAVKYGAALAQEEIVEIAK
jgi:uncharacterized protein (DUF433 family)